MLKSAPCFPLAPSVGSPLKRPTIAYTSGIGLARTRRPQVACGYTEAPGAFWKMPPGLPSMAELTKSQ